MKIKKLISIPLLIFLAVVNVRLFADPGMSAAKFLQLSPSPRAAALGNAYTSFADDADSVYYNPAVLSVIRDIKFSASYVLWLDSMGYFSFFTVCPVKPMFSISAGILGLTSGPILETTDPGSGNISLTGRSFSSGEYCFMAGCAYGILDALNVGVLFKIISERLDDRTSSSFAGDLGLYYRWDLYGIKAGLVVQNVGMNAKFINETFPLPVTIKFGLNYNIILTKWNNIFRNIIVTADVRKPILEGFSAGFGMETDLLQYFSLRLGYDLQPNNDSQGFMFGAGFRYNRLIVGMNRLTVQINYSMDMFHSFTPAHFFEINLTSHFFGDKVPSDVKSILHQADTFMSNISTYSDALLDYSEVAQSVPSHIRSAYNIACIYSTKGDIANAVSWLSKVLKRDHRALMFLRIQRDPDFDPIRNTPEFKKLMKKYGR